MKILKYSILSLCFLVAALTMNACGGGTGTEATNESTTDTGPVDSGPVDNGSADEGPMDKGLVDDGPVDSGPMDMGPGDEPAEATPKSIVEIASGNPDFSILVAALQKADLVAAVQANDLTVFAPTNAAFASLLKDDLGLTVDANDPLKDLTKEQLIPILKYHVLGSKVDSTAATTAAQNNSEVDSLGGKIKLSLDGNNIKLDGRATVTTADIMATNGIIHVIDKVILPSIVDVATTDSNFSILAAALTKAELVTAVEAKDLTVFAPTNAAFASLLKDDLGITVDANDPLKDLTKEQLIPILKYHVLGSKVDATAATTAAQNNSEVDSLGGKIKLSLDGNNIKLDARATVAAANIFTENGIIHVIDKVILPSIVDVATTDSNFSILAAALTKAGLVAAVEAKDLTVFAPTNAAFASLLKDDLGMTVDANDPLKDLTKEQLIPILKYHVIPSRVDAATATAAAQNNSEVNSMGGKIKLSLDGNNIKLDARATVAAANVFTENGIIHVIDKVILPTITDVLSKSAKELGLEQLLAAVGAADNGKADADKLTTLLNGAGPFTVFAPMDSGFAKVLADNSIADLGALVTALGGQDALISLLKYHVAAARLDSTAVIAANGKEVDVASGGKISVTVENGMVIVNKGVTAAVMGVNDSTVKVVDIYTANGVIHILDKVIAPAKTP